MICVKFPVFHLLPFIYFRSSLFPHAFVEEDHFLITLSLAHVLFGPDNHHPVLDCLVARAGFAPSLTTEPELTGSLVVLPVDVNAESESGDGGGGARYRIGVLRGFGPFIYRAYDGDAAQGGLLPLDVAECNLPYDPRDVEAAVRAALSPSPTNGDDAAYTVASSSFVATPEMLVHARAHIDRTFAVAGAADADRTTEEDTEYPARIAAALALRFHIPDAVTGNSFNGLPEDPLSEAQCRRLYDIASFMSVLQMIDISKR